MKKICALFLFFCSKSLVAQFWVDCNSHRFDQEVFSGIIKTSNVQYGSNTNSSGTTTNLTMDIYQPDGDTMQTRPLIIWAHGGSFISGTKNDPDVVALSEHFARRGYVCASIDYRLGVPFPINQENAIKAVYRAVQDMKAAVRFFRMDAATANTYRIEPSVIFAGGSSAGAFMSLHLAYLDKLSELPVTIDTVAMGNLEGNSGNPGYGSSVSAVIDLCGALGSKTYIEPGNVPFAAMHGTADGTVPYATAMLNMLGVFQIMVVDGSYSLAAYANSIGVYNEMYTFYGADHVPYLSNTNYMDTTVRFVSNFLYRFLNCTPYSQDPLPNTFTAGIEQIASVHKVLVSPNPGNGEFIFNFENEKTDELGLSIFDIRGKTVFETNHCYESMKINLSYLDKAVYFYRINTNDTFITGKLAVQ